MRRFLLTAFALALSSLSLAAPLTAEQNGDMKARYAYEWKDGKGVATGLTGEYKGLRHDVSPLPGYGVKGVALVASGDQHLALNDAAGRPVAYYHTVTDRWFSAEGYERRNNFGAVAWCVLGGYFLLMFLMGVYFARKEKDADDFFRGGKRIPWYVAGMSIFATMMSSITFISAPAQYYISDWRYLTMSLVTLALCPVVIRWFLPYFRRLDLTCAYEYLERRFNLGARLFASAAFVVFMVCRIAVVTLLPAIVLNAMTGADIDVCIVLCGLATILYCAFGGFEAVVWSDFVQGLVLISGTVAILVVLIAKTDGGLSGAYELAMANGKMRTWDFRPLFTEPVFWVVLVYGFTQNLFSYTSDQCIIQRYVSVKDEKAAGRSLWFNGLVDLAVTMLFYMMGSALWTHYHSHPELTDVTMSKPDGILPLFIVSELPGWLAGLVVAAIFAATVSTLSATLSASASAVTSDFILRFRKGLSGKTLVRCGQVLVTATGVLGTGVALILARVETRSLFDNFQDFIAMLTSGLAALFFIGVFMPKVKGRAAVIGLAANYVVCFALRFIPMPFEKPHFFLYGGIGFAVCIVVALLVSAVSRGAGDGAAKAA